MFELDTGRINDWTERNPLPRVQSQSGKSKKLTFLNATMGGWSGIEWR